MNVNDRVALKWSVKNPGTVIEVTDDHFTIKWDRHGNTISYPWECEDNLVPPRPLSYEQKIEEIKHLCEQKNKDLSYQSPPHTWFSPVLLKDAKMKQFIDSILRIIND